MDADVLASERLTETDLAPPHANASAARQGDRTIVQRILERHASILTGRVSVELGPIAHVQRLVGPLDVIALDEVIELCLLLQKILRRRLGRFLLKPEMHALVSAVLLRMAGLDALGADAKA